MPDVRKCPTCGVLAVRHPNAGKHSLFDGHGRQLSGTRCLNAECPQWDDWPKHDDAKQDAA